MLLQLYNTTKKFQEEDKIREKKKNSHTQKDNFSITSGLNAYYTKTLGITSI